MVDEVHGGGPTIPGGRCLACGFVFAPAQAYGCERCGAFGDQLETYAVPATGRVTSAAIVRVHRFPRPPTPFSVLEIILDAGPVIRVLADTVLQAGTRTVRGADGADGLPRFVADRGAYAS